MILRLPVVPDAETVGDASIQWRDRKLQRDRAGWFLTAHGLAGDLISARVTVAAACFCLVAPSEAAWAIVAELSLL